jgi:hypothetical protein
MNRQERHRAAKINTNDGADRLVTSLALHRKALGQYLTKIAQLGGYLARSTDPPPGNTIM